MYRWHLAANFLVLRIISFNMDAHWASQLQKIEPTRPNSAASADLTAPSESITPCSDGSRDIAVRAASPRPEEEYSLVNCLAYCLYCPLYMAGPILSFNAFMSYVSTPTPIRRPGDWQHTYEVRCANIILPTPYVPFEIRCNPVRLSLGSVPCASRGDDSLLSAFRHRLRRYYDL